MAASPTMKVLVAGDSYGYSLCEVILQHLQEHHAETVEAVDCGCDTKYWAAAYGVGRAVNDAEREAPGTVRGILCCGSGIGVAIIANRFPRVFASPATTVDSAENSRQVCNSNVLTLGARVTEAQEGCRIVDAWLSTGFAEGWAESLKEALHQNSVDIAALDFSDAAPPLEQQRQRMHTTASGLS